MESLWRTETEMISELPPPHSNSVKHSFFFFFFYIVNGKKPIGGKTSRLVRQPFICMHKRINSKSFAYASLDFIECVANKMRSHGYILLILSQVFWYLFYRFTSNFIHTNNPHLNNVQMKSS